MKKQIVQFIRSAENLETITGNAVTLAKTLDLEVKLLMVLETRYPYFYPMTSTLKTGLETYEFERIHEERRKEEEKVLKKFADKKNAETTHPRVSFEIFSGATDMVLIDVSEQPETFLILITQAHEPEQGFIINTYLNTLEKTRCPVLKIPVDFNFGEVSKILYATDYNKEDVDTLLRLVEIAHPFNAEITTLHITDSLDMEEKLKRHGFESSIQEKIGYEQVSFAVQADKDVVHGIMEYARKGHFDLIVLLKENRNFLQRLFTRSDSNKILAEADVPVMICHEKN
ncbi:MAG: universal stress protein [Bacteroidales bacterium]|nr:universal stress protein [Bacteroidales bacterium]